MGWIPRIQAIVAASENRQHDALLRPSGASATPFLPFGLTRSDYLVDPVPTPTNHGLHHGSDKEPDLVAAKHMDIRLVATSGIPPWDSTP